MIKVHPYTFLLCYSELVNEILMVSLGFILGMSTGGISSFRLNTSTQSSPSKKGCSFSYSASLTLPSLFLGSLHSSFFMISLASGDIPFGILSGPLNNRIIIPFDVLEQNLLLGVVVGRQPNDQFIEQETQQIPIDSTRVPLLG